MTNKCVMGIDLGTSSVKVLCRYQDGKTLRAREAYDENTPQGWLGAVKKALGDVSPEIAPGGLVGIGLSSQTGTYIVEGEKSTRVIMWHEPRDGAHLKKLLASFSREEFMREISMPHPKMLSYPVPNLMRIKEEWGGIHKIYQPKDFLCEALTGHMATDIYTWRGLANLTYGSYSKRLLDFAGIDEGRLPPILGCTKMAGFYGGVPVFVGCNDFFAGLLGMGIWECGDGFDVTGTSEHIGVVTEAVGENENLVCGGYLNHNVCYGVTSSGGAALKWAAETFGGFEPPEDPWEALCGEPPVFLPYITGEPRAPVWDADARGVFFGIGEKADRRALVYSVFEGVCFALYAILEMFGGIGRHIGGLGVAGGAADNCVLNKIKAELFGIPLYIADETDASALGAAMVAAVGAGWHENLHEATLHMAAKKKAVLPSGAYRGKLLARYGVFSGLYPILKHEFKKLGGT